METDILIVDDDAIHCFLHESLLSKNQLKGKPSTFPNGKEAYDFLIANDYGQEVLILLDINMPVMNGWQFMDKISEHSFQSEIKVVIVTSSVDKADQEKATNYEQLVGFMNKPLLTESIDDIRKICSC